MVVSVCVSAVARRLLFCRRLICVSVVPPCAEDRGTKSVITHNPNRPSRKWPHWRASLQSNESLWKKKQKQWKDYSCVSVICCLCTGHGFIFIILFHMTNWGGLKKVRQSLSTAACQLHTRLTTRRFTFLYITLHAVFKPLRQRTDESLNCNNWSSGCILMVQYVRIFTFKH